MAALGGTGNGVQWVSMVSAVQELTRAGMQARVISVLEASAAATPGLGFVIGGVIAATFSPRAAFLVAGAGVVAVAAVAAAILGSGWGGRSATRPDALDSDDEVMVQLRPRDGRPTT